MMYNKYHQINHKSTSSIYLIKDMKMYTIFIDSIKFKIVCFFKKGRLLSFNLF
jgi:hypothetical protein